MWSRWWPYLALAVLAFGIYGNALRNGFVHDDGVQLLENPLVVDYHKLPVVFSQDVWAFAKVGDAKTSNYYRPIQICIYMGLYYLIGFSAPGYHLVLVLLHVANTLLVFQLSRHFLRHLRQPLAAALAAGALFAIHPVHDEAVVWIAVLPDVLITAIGLIMLLWFIRQNAAPRKWQIAGHGALFLVAMLTKETAVMLVPLLAGYEWLYLGRNWREIWKNAAFYCGLGLMFVVYLLLRWNALGSLAPAQSDRFNVHGMTLAFCIVVLMGRYLSYLVLPRSLCVLHVYQPTRSITPWVILSLLAILAIIAAIFWLRRRPDPARKPSIGRHPEISYGLLFILAPLLPVMNINGIGENVFAERYLYLPSVGFAWIAAEVLEWLWNRQRIVAATIALLAGLAWCAMVWTRTPEWHDNASLFRSAEQVYPNAWNIESLYASALIQEGDVGGALRHYRVAIQANPADPCYAITSEGCCCGKVHVRKRLRSSRKPAASTRHSRRRSRTSH